MTVYFVYRCHYTGPSEKYVKHFDDDSVLDWFRNRWHLRTSDINEAQRRTDREIGFNVYSLFDIFYINPDHSDPNQQPPRNAKQLADQFRGTYHNEILCKSEHCIQVLTDDDELDMAYYLFDDHFLKDHGDKAAFLLNDGWKLPSGHAAGPFKPMEPSHRLAKVSKGEGATYAVFLGFYGAGGNLDDLNPDYGGHRIDGIRIPELARFLMQRNPKEDWPGELVELRPVLPAPSKKASAIEKAFLQDIRNDPANDLAWNAYSDWLQDNDELPAGLHLLRQALLRLGREEDLKRIQKEGNPSQRPLAYDCRELPIEQAYQYIVPYIRELDRLRGAGGSLVHVEEHLAQMCLNVGYNAFEKASEFHQWIMFDDLWGAAHPALANAILCFGRRWDVLSTTKRPKGRD